jgi:hypothetical protein
VTGTSRLAVNIASTQMNVSYRTMNTMPSPIDSLSEVMNTLFIALDVSSSKR